MDDDKKELSEAGIQAGLHWEYVEKTLQIHCIDQSELDLCAHHYKTAFIHGWKHGQEAMKTGRQMMESPRGSETVDHCKRGGK